MILRLFHALLPTLLLCVSIAASSNQQHVPEMTALLGSSVVISCHSSLAPAWQWSNSKNDANRILALSGVDAHPTLDDPRFKFTRNGNVFSVSISEVRLADAGTYSCLGDSFVSTVLNVLR